MVNCFRFGACLTGASQTGYALSFCLYNLARNVDKQHRLIAELDRVVPRGEPVTGAVLSRLSYLKACVKESFRSVHASPFLLPHCVYHSDCL